VHIDTQALLRHRCIGSWFQRHASRLQANEALTDLMKASMQITELTPADLRKMGQKEQAEKISQ